MGCWHWRLGLPGGLGETDKLAHLAPNGPAPPTPAVDVGDPRLTVDEVRQLWWFLDGAMMDVHIRRHLHRSWGFCPRHAWAHAVVECELRGVRPFATAILYEDLTRRAAKAVAVWPRLSLGGLAIRSLRASASCLTCDHVQLATDLDRKGARMLELGRDWTERQRRANRLQRVLPLLLESKELWSTRSCPACLGGSGLICRPHLLEGGSVPAGLGEQLATLADRLRALVNSMCWGGKPAQPLERVSWVEALGWFAGWDWPAKLAQQVA